MQIVSCQCKYKSLQARFREQSLRQCVLQRNLTDTEVIAFLCKDIRIVAEVLIQLVGVVTGETGIFCRAGLSPAFQHLRISAGKLVFPAMKLHIWRCR